VNADIKTANAEQKKHVIQRALADQKSQEAELQRESRKQRTLKKRKVIVIYV